MRTNAFASLPLLSSLASAAPPPEYNQYRLLWLDSFDGSSGSSPDPNVWTIITGFLNINNDVETYTASNQSLQISGSGTLLFVPRKDLLTGQWTSGRIESKAAFTPRPSKKTTFEAAIRFGTNPQANKQGLWPAFWLLGESVHYGTPWPLCGELDIMEVINGAPTGYGVAHCGSKSGGPCDEPTGRVGTVTLADDGWHTWTLLIDRTGAGGWQGEKLVWLIDQQAFHQVTGVDIGDEETWAALAHSPMFIILNLAVGGWPGAPNSATKDGYGSMMVVEYTAVYST